MRDSTIFSNRSNRSSSVESADSPRASRGVRPGLGSGTGVALKRTEPGAGGGNDGTARGAGAAGVAGAGSTAAVDGCGSRAGSRATVHERPVFNLGPEPAAGGLGVARRPTTLDPASPGPGEKLTAADATAGTG